MCRACDERALRELFKNNKLHAENVILIGIACTDELAKACKCKNPRPSDMPESDAPARPFDRSDVEAIISMPVDKRFAYWTGSWENALNAMAAGIYAPYRSRCMHTGGPASGKPR